MLPPLIHGLLTFTQRRQFLVYQRKNEAQGKYEVWVTHRCGVAGIGAAPVRPISQDVGGGGGYDPAFVLSTTAPALALDSADRSVHVVFTTAGSGGEDGDVWWATSTFPACP